MSRIGKRPVVVPAGVTVALKGSHIAVKGPKGELARSLHPEMAVAFADGQVSVSRPSDEKRHKALHGLTRTLVANMVEGVTTGYQKVLELQAHKRGLADALLGGDKSLIGDLKREDLELLLS